MTLVRDAPYDGESWLYPIGEQQLLMISFEKLADKALASHPDADTDLLRKAYDFSACLLYTSDAADE